MCRYLIVFLTAEQSRSLPSHRGALVLSGLVSFAFEHRLRQLLAVKVPSYMVTNLHAIEFGGTKFTRQLAWEFKFDKLANRTRCGQ